MIMLAVDVTARQQPVKTWKQCKKLWFESLLEKLVKTSLMACNFFGCFCYEICESKICSKIVDQKECLMSIALELLITVNNDFDLLKRAITGDETCVFGYDVEMKV